MLNTIRKKESGFTLLEIIIIISVLSILSAVAAPYAINSYIEKMSEAEVIELASISEGIMLHTSTNKTIPAATAAKDPATIAGTVPGWASAVGGISSINNIDVSKNKTGLPRVFVYPDNFISTGVSLPYDQPQRATESVLLAAAPANPRAMIITDMRNDITATITSGPIAVATFNAIWDQTGGGVTESKTLKIQRINFSGVLINTLFNNNDMVNQPAIKVDGLPLAGITLSPGISQTPLWLIKGSKVDLIDSIGAVAYSHIVKGPIGFVYSLDSWGSVLGAPGAGGAGLGSVFDPAQSGLLTNWGTDPGCTPTGTSYSLTMDNNANNEDYNLYTGAGGAATYIRKVKKGKVKSANVGECELVVLVPKGNNSTSIYIFYMPHSNFTIVLN